MSVTILADPRTKMTRPQAVQLARELWGDGTAWTVEEIRQYLAGRGHRVAWSTVAVWVDSDYGRRRRARQRELQRRWARERRGTGRFRVFDRDAVERARRASEVPPDVLLTLRVEDGLSYGAIAKVARRFFGVELTEDQVRYRLYGLGAPKNPNKTRAKEAA